MQANALHPRIRAHISDLITASRLQKDLAREEQDMESLRDARRNMVKAVVYATRAIMRETRAEYVTPEDLLSLQFTQSEIDLCSYDAHQHLHYGVRWNEWLGCIKAAAATAAFVAVSTVWVALACGVGA